MMLQVISNMHQYKKNNKLKEKLLLIMADSLSTSELRELHQVFNVLDVDGSGKITAENILTALSATNVHCNREDLNRLIEKLNEDHGNYLSWQQVGAILLAGGPDSPRTRIFTT